MYNKQDMNVEMKILFTWLMLLNRIKMLNSNVSSSSIPIRILKINLSRSSFTLQSSASSTSLL